MYMFLDKSDFKKKKERNRRQEALAKKKGWIKCQLLLMFVQIWHISLSNDGHHWPPWGGQYQQSATSENIPQPPNTEPLSHTVSSLKKVVRSPSVWDVLVLGFSGHEWHRCAIRQSHKERFTTTYTLQFITSFWWHLKKKMTLTSKLVTASWDKPST